MSTLKCAFGKVRGERALTGPSARPASRALSWSRARPGVPLPSAR
jgi:hypothetical protein